MSSAKFSLPSTGAPNISDHECTQILTRHLGSFDFELLGVKIVRLQEHVIGLLGEHWKMTISVLHPQSSEEGTLKRSELTYFVKTLPKTPVHLEFVESTGLFYKEITLYSFLLPELGRYVAGDNAGPSWPVCACYHTRPDLLALQDLSGEGYRTLPNRTYLDISHLSAVLRSLARFHSASIILEETKSKETGKTYRINQHFSDVCFESVYLNYDEPKEYILTSIEVLLNLLEIMAEHREASGLPNTNRSKLTDYCDIVWTLVEPSERYRNVLCHGDIWVNNIMFRCEGAKCSPVDVRLVDFQLARYVPPSLDVMLLLHFSTSRAFRQTHMEDVLSHYYSCLTDELNRHGLCAEDLLSWTDFKESCRSMRHFGLITAGMVFPSILMDDETMTKTYGDPEAFTKYWAGDRIAVVRECFKKDVTYRQRITELLEEIVDVVGLQL